MEYSDHLISVDVSCIEIVVIQKWFYFSLELVHGIQTE